MADTDQTKLPVSDDEKNQRTKRVLQRAQWLRAAILGANDGLLSTSLLMLGVGAAKEDRGSMILSGIAGAIAGACSMAVGEFVSVSTQRDIEIMATTTTNKNSKSEACGGHVSNGHEMMIKVDIGADILAMSSIPSAPSVPSEKAIGEKKMVDEEDKEVLPDPYKAAAASAVAFLFGSLFPLLAAIFVVQDIPRIVAIVVVTLVALALFGGMGARLGGSPVRVSAVRVFVGGLIAMGITYGILKLFDSDD